ncbi:MOSC domain-containing protein [Primorskyibacter sp. S187A]|uniref:MOSC domain-containing protein n=1 Tax=Primorskyibacter sp. S187A TaxID=3415130 RepID=UPI003C79B4DA
MTGRVTQIIRHPIKSHGREDIAQVRLTAGCTLPGDRIWAVAHEQSTVDGSRWAPCQNFTRGSKVEGLGAMQATLDAAFERVALEHPLLGKLDLNPDTEGQKLIDWTRPLIPENRAASARVVRAQEQGFTDSDFPSITLCNHASHRAVEQRIGHPLSIYRWRGNFWFDGLAPWEEFDWIDREVRIGTAIVIPRERTDRCLATHNNPDTGKRDANVLGALDSWGHRDFSVRAEVVQAGEISVGDGIGRA